MACSNRNSNNIDSSGVSSSGIDSIAASKTASVPPKATDITVSPLASSMAVGDTLHFKATTKDTHSVAIHWAGSAPSMATINSSGVAIGIGAGKTESRLQRAV
ncbi:MAG: hypothetical protein CXZ00_00050 [Acidobacteria bacterium]|nr:MAG: hypothetical protein CXZ00_00050 [Acidobacteriota bacterium]